MADTGFVLCTAATDLNDTATINWANVSNIFASDEAYAVQTATSAKSGDTLKAFTFNLSIPSGATIDGVETRVEAKATSGSVTIGSVNIGKSDAALGTPKTPGDSLTGSDANYDHGGATDLWGLSLSEAEVEDSTFQVRYRFSHGASSSVSVDAVWVKVYYTTASSIVDAAVSAAGTSAPVWGAAATVASALSGAGVGAAFGAGSTGSQTDTDAALSGTSTLTASGSALSVAGGSAQGSSSAAFIAENSGLPLPDYTPIGLGGGFGPGYRPDKQRFRTRKDKSHPKVITVRIGNWPEDPQIILERREQAERDEFYQSFPDAPFEEIVESGDDEEAILLAILAIAA